MASVVNQNCIMSLMSETIAWNPNVRLVLADVDETIADVYTPAEPEMISALNQLLHDGIKLFMVSGGSLARIRRDIVDIIDPALRHDVLISHCSGAEVWGFANDGKLRDRPFYSVYEETFTPGMKETWREIVNQLVDEFGFRTHQAQPKPVFWEAVGRDPHDIMLDDRGPQITFEVVNGIDLDESQLDSFSQEIPLSHDGRHDLRLALQQRATELFEAGDIPITPRLGGTFALDLAVAGISKTTSIQTVLAMPEVLSTIGLSANDILNTHELEIWGDKFSIVNGGTDLHMCEAVSPEVRAIDFRQEPPEELPTDFNVKVWDGKQHLHHGLLEYLQSRDS